MTDDDLPFGSTAPELDAAAIERARIRVDGLVRVRRRRRRTWVAAPAIGVLVASALVAVGIGRHEGPDHEAVSSATRGAGSVGGWVRVDDWPLPARTAATNVWTGSELLVIGGVLDTCPARADCAGPARRFADGAALDPKTGHWRTIAPAPWDLDVSSAVAVGRSVFVWATPDPQDMSRGPFGRPAGMLRYDIERDRWSEEWQPNVDQKWWSLVAAGDRLIADPGSDERSDVGMWLFDPGPRTWQQLPDDPLPKLFDRSVVYDQGDVYLFGKELIPQPGSERPALQLAARLDLATMRWEELPASQSIGAGMWAAGDGVMLNPSLGGADGGEVNNWGRRYPEGAVFDAAERRWRDLPEVPGLLAGRTSSGFLGSERSLFLDVAGGALFDVAADAWIEMPSAPGGTNLARMTGTAGDVAVALLGSRPTNGGLPEPLRDVWIWRPPDRSRPTTASSSTTPSTTSSTSIPPDDATPPSTPDDVPDTVQITCASGRASVSGSAVRAQPDGVHLSVDNTSGEPAVLNVGQGGDQVPTGVTATVQALAPGTVSVSCGYDENRRIVPAGTIEVTDPAGVWRPTDLDCSTLPLTSWEGEASTAASPEDAVRWWAANRPEDLLAPVAADDDIAVVGYPEAVEPVYVTRHAGSDTNIFVLRRVSGGWQATPHEGCQRSSRVPG